jgi:hypothetical protein
MRCLSCNVALSDFESTRKSAATNEFIGLCNHCFLTIADDVATLERTDLAHEEDDVDLDHDSIDSMDIELDNDDR